MRIIGLMACVLMAGTTFAQLNRVYVYTFDFDFSINPPDQPIVDVVIQPGTEVVWALVNDLHSTSACVGQAEYWESGVLFRNESYPHIFTIPGVYNYYCSPHGFDNGDGTATGMTGTVTVLPAPSMVGLMVAASVVAIRRRR